MKKYKISVIIPVYNKEEYIEKCLDSILNQTLKEIEIICVDDGSTDQSYKILNTYMKKYKNIKVIHQKNQGVNGARVTGYNNATGQFIAWVDADDFVEKEMYEKMYNLAIKNCSDVVICNYNFFPKKTINKDKWYKKYMGNVDWKFVAKNTIQCNKIVKKSLLDKIQITKLFNLVGEGCYSFVLMSTNLITTTDECLYNYRVGHSSLSSNFNNIDWYIKTVERSKLRFEYAKENNFGDYWCDYLFFVYLYYVLILLIVSCFNNRKDLYIKCKKIIRNNKMFDKKNKEYLMEYLSKNKIMYFKYIGVNNFTLTKIISRIILK